MKKNIYLLIFSIFLVNFAFSQEKSGLSSITIDASQQITNFVFVDGGGIQENTFLILGENNNYKPLYSGAYNIGYSYLFDFGLMIRSSVGMRNSGATMVYDAVNYEWGLQYLNSKVGVGYAFKLGRFSPYIVPSFYFGYLLKANQLINNENFDIIDSGAISKIDYGVNIPIGVRLDASEYISIYTEVAYLMGISNIEAADVNQKANNLALSFTLGLSFAIK